MIAYSGSLLWECLISERCHSFVVTCGFDNYMTCEAFLKLLQKEPAWHSFELA